MEPRLLLFWTLAALTAAAAGLLILRGASRGARRAGAEGDAALEALRRQYAEIDGLAERGLLDASERAAARAEAGRRLLAEADRAKAPWTAAGARGAVAAAVLAGLGALGLYLWLGSPALPDRPFAARLAAWRAADPASLPPAELAAVLGALVKERPRDPQAYDYLGQTLMASQQPAQAVQAFAKAAALAPQRADLQIKLGMALWTQGEGPTAPAQAAFRRALAIDPGNVDARVLLAEADIRQGRTAEGKAALQAVIDSLPAGDERRAAVQGALADAFGAPQVPQDAQGQAAMIRGMVDGLAARLKDQPDDPEGWARLVRAYKVLGEADKQAQALATARKLYAGRPEVLAPIEAAAR